MLEMILILILLPSMSNNSYTDIFVNNLYQESMTQLNIENHSSDSKTYYGQWEIINHYTVGAPTVWGDEVASFIGEKILISAESVEFQGNVLKNPVFSERELTDEEIAWMFLTTYQALGIEADKPIKFITIYKNKTMNESWLSDSEIYRFFVKDETTLIAENRNVYFTLVKIE